MMKKTILLLALIILISGCVRQAYEGAKADKGQNNEWVNDISHTGTGSCTTREECEKMLGKGAFCSYGKCFLAPEDYVEGMAICNCPDGTEIRAKDCRWADCPGTPTTSAEFTVKDGIVPKTTADISFPLSGKEAKTVAIAACGISAQTSEPSSPYENIIFECSPAWDFLDETNPCNNKQAHVCGEKAFASCVFGGQTINAFCINGLPIVQGEYQEKFVIVNPIDLSQVKKFAKFRSCAGHDHSGYNDKGELETERSMKQSALPLPGVTKMDIYAPFDGIITRYFTTTFENDPIEEHEIEILGNHSGKWFITFGHFTLKEGFEVGSKVTAGEFIGTSTINDLYKGPELGLNQDVSTETVKEQFVRGSLLDYAIDEVLAEYALYGLTPENVIYTKEYRDANPCTWDSTSENPDDFVTLKRD